MRDLLRRYVVVCLLGLGLALAACDDKPDDVGEACDRRSDCEKMCLAVCDPAPCTQSATNFWGECSDTVQCSFELDSQGSLSPTVCP